MTKIKQKIQAYSNTSATEHGSAPDTAAKTITILLYIHSEYHCANPLEFLASKFIAAEIAISSPAENNVFFICAIPFYMIPDYITAFVKGK